MSKKKYISGHFSYKTDIGKVRLTNEDQAVALINARGNVLLAVCDGMGGANKGDLASSLAIKYLVEAFEEKDKFFSRYGAIIWLTNTIRKANKIIFDEAEKNEAYQGMGTTMTCVLIVGGYYFTAQVGDSRAYMLKNNKLEQITQDQTYVGYLYRTGQIKKEEMNTHPKRHVLLNALGIFPSLEVDVKTSLYNDESFLICSDGLYNNLTDRDIESVMQSNENVDMKVKQLIALANSNGGSDNIGVALWEEDK